MPNLTFAALAVGSVFFYQGREFTIQEPYQTNTRDQEGNLVEDENLTGWLAIHTHEEGFRQKLVITPVNFDALELSLTAPEAASPEEDND